MAELTADPAVTGRRAALLKGTGLRYPTGPDAHSLAGRFVPALGGLDRHLNRHFDDPRPILFNLGSAPRELPCDAVAP
ncbi:hypothetical protein CFN78_11935 [Amycolatopsis antarctica]|uniref:Uncharacterized protein n=1 Tax=Amycolatopsis antarctica TaxID=1854586 RepID=A0A263D657_9PSEU|nr:hypothetical protein [Amycolatopsis antarctica]OZM72956.1 hypothetical protein CFN78_11935 [Amycolatopsis antarctica]